MKLSSPMLVLSVAVALAGTTVNASDRVLARNRIANNIKRNLIKVDAYASASTGKLKEIVQLDDTDFYRQLGIGSMSMPSNNKPSSGGDSEDGDSSSSGGGGENGGSSSSGGGSADGGSSSSGGGNADGGNSSSGGGSADGGTSSSGGGSEDGGSSSNGGGSEDGGSSSSGGGSDPSTSSTDTGTDGTGTDGTGSGDTGVDDPVEAPTEAAGADSVTGGETAPSPAPVGPGGIPASTPLSSPTVDEDATFVPTNTTDSSSRRNRAMGAVATALTIAVTVVPFL